MNDNMNNKKITCFARPPHFGRRILMMIIGVTVMGLGLSILRAINLGVDPCSCLTQGVANYLPFSFGTCQVLCHLATFVFVLKYDMSFIGYGTVGNMLFLGYISDFFTWVWELALPAGFFEITAVRYAALIPTLAVFLLGVGAYVSAGIGSSPYDAMPFIISDHVKRFSFKMIRVVWDVAFMVIGFALGGAIGIVTIAVAFFCGPVIAWVQKKVEVFLK